VNALKTCGQGAAGCCFLHLADFLTYVSEQWLPPPQVGQKPIALRRGQTTEGFWTE